MQVRAWFIPIHGLFLIETVQRVHHLGRVRAHHNAVAHRGARRARRGRRTPRR